MKSRVKLNNFNKKHGFDVGRSFFVVLTWYFFKNIIFKTFIPWPTTLKVLLLKLYGARIGQRLLIKPNVNIHFPWKLEIGDDCWIGEEAWILNFADIKIGSNVCISQRVFLCSGSHDYRDNAMTYRNQPILVHDGVWIGAQAFIAPGVTIETDSVVSAGSVVTTSVVAGVVVGGNPAIFKRNRWNNR